MSKNKYYNYDHIELWSGASWKPRLSCTYPLVRWMQTHGNIHFRGRQQGSCKGEWKESFMNNHSINIVYPEYVKKLEDEYGIIYSSSKMGITRWLGIAPKDIFEKTSPEPEIIMILMTDVDYGDEMWAMDALGYHMEYLKWAGSENKLLLFVATDGVDPDDMYISVLNEVASIYHISMKKVLLDVDPVYELGYTLKNIPDFTLVDKYGNTVSDPDSIVTREGPMGFAALDITGIWMHKDSLLQSLLNREENHNTLYSYEDFLHSAAGKRMAEAIYLEYAYDSVYDPEYINVIEGMGLKLDCNKTAGEQWVMLTPKGAFDDQNRKIPLVVLMQEVPAANPHTPITSISYNYGWLDIAAQGDCAVLLFALESVKDNDLLSDIIIEAAELYPVDPTRVYITGHSHNCNYVNEFMHRHPYQITAGATLGVPLGYSKWRISDIDELLDDMSRVDMPMIHCVGRAEHSCHVPLHSDAPYLTEMEKKLNPSPAFLFKNRAEAWQRRLKMSGCRVATLEEIAATKDSDDYVERILGVPADKTECLYLGGFENYIADIKNLKGKYHLRVVANGNMPHTVTPLVNDLCWSFFRRFKRDPETHEIIELY